MNACHKQLCLIVEEVKLALGLPQEMFEVYLCACQICEVLPEKNFVTVKLLPLTNARRLRQCRGHRFGNHRGRVEELQPRPRAALKWPGNLKKLTVQIFKFGVFENFGLIFETFVFLPLKLQFCRFLSKFVSQNLVFWKQSEPIKASIEHLKCFLDNPWSWMRNKLEIKFKLCRYVQASPLNNTNVRIDFLTFTRHL